MSDRPMHTIPGAFQHLQTLYADGERALQEGRLDDAVAAFDAGLAIDDHFRQRYVTMYAQRAFARQQLGDFAGAIDDYGHAIAMEPDLHQAQYHFYRGMCHSALEHADDALADYSRSIALYPDHPGPWHLRGKLNATVLGRFEDAVRDLDRLMELAPHPEGFQLRGYARLRLGQPAEALPDLIEADRLAPEGYTSYLLAWAAALAADDDSFFDAMAAALSSEPSFQSYFETHPDFARVRQDPRFARVLGQA